MNAGKQESKKRPRSNSAVRKSFFFLVFIDFIFSQFFTRKQFSMHWLIVGMLQIQFWILNCQQPWKLFKVSQNFKNFRCRFFRKLLQNIFPLSVLLKPKNNSILKNPHEVNKTFCDESFRENCQNQNFFSRLTTLAGRHKSNLLPEALKKFLIVFLNSPEASFFNHHLSFVWERLTFFPFLYRKLDKNFLLIIEQAPSEIFPCTHTDRKKEVEACKAQPHDEKKWKKERRKERRSEKRVRNVNDRPTQAKYFYVSLLEREKKSFRKHIFSGFMLSFKM